MSNTTVQTKHAGDPLIHTEVNDMVTAINSKQDAIAGKQLTDQNYTLVEKQNLANQTGVNTGDQDLSGLVVKITGKGLSTNDLTDTRASKLDALSEHYVGNYPSLASLQAAHAVGQAGQYGTVDVVGQNAQTYIWDVTDNIWVPSSSTAGAVTSVNGQTGAVVLTKAAFALDLVPNVDATLRANHTGTQSADTITDGANNKVYTTAEKAKVANQSGVNTGDQDLSALLPKTSKATQAQATAGTEDTQYMTALKTAQAIAALSPVAALQAETTTYAGRIFSAGSSIGASDLFALDSFVATGKKDGWWPLIKFFAPMMGADISGALVKFVTDASGINSMNAFNVLATDYSPELGFVIPYGTNTNTNKYISTGFIPTNNGLSSANIGCAFVSPDNTPDTTPLIGDNPASGPNTIVVGAGKAGTSDFYGGNVTGGRRAIVFSVGTASIYQYANGTETSEVPPGLTPTAALNTEITIFRFTSNGALGYANGAVSMLLFTSYLTKALSYSLNKAVIKLMKATGRFNTTGGISYWFGDSITAGQAASSASKRFASIVSRLSGTVEYNVAVPSSQLRQNILSSPYAVGGYARYTDLSTQPMNNIFIMYGTNDLNNNDSAATGTPASITDYQTKIAAIYAYFVAKNVRVIALSIPWNTAKTDSLTKIPAYFAANYSAAKSSGVTFVDCYNIFLDTGNPALYFADNLHPNDAGNLLIANHAFAAMLGRIYRDALISSVAIPANSSTTQVVMMYGIKNNSQLLVGTATTPTAGITYSAVYTSDDTVTVTISNSTAGSITPPAVNLRLTFLLDS